MAKNFLKTYKLIADNTFDRIPLATRDGVVIPLQGIQAEPGRSKK